MGNVRISFAAILLLVISGSAHAMGVTWTFQNALFDDGTALTGSFDYNDTRVGPFGYSNVDVHTQSRGDMIGQHYTSVRLLSGALGFTSKSGDQSLGVGFDEWVGLGNSAGSSVSIKGGEELKGVIGTETIWLPFIGTIEKEIKGVIADRHLVSGAITRTVQELSEPGTLATFVIGLAALLVLYRRRARV